MPAKLRFTNEQIISAYKETGSVWSAAKKLGACGQSVWERLSRLNYQMPGMKWGEAEIEELKALAPQCTIGEMARRLGRPYAAVACKISELQIGVRYGNRVKWKIKRGTGLTKKSVTQYIKELDMFGGTLRHFVKQRGLDLESFVKAIQKYDSEYWTRYVKGHSSLSPMMCPQCHCEFIPMTNKQRTCSRKCAAHHRADRKYFGGKRSYAVGLTEGICQLCEKEKKSLSAHHIFGKENDQENDYLIALCAGCHQSVGILGSRKDVEQVEFWENLISLAVARKLGPRKPAGFHVIVEIEELNKEEAAELA